jgi:acetolactate synthase-1/2/3 large subunit
MQKIRVADVVIKYLEKLGIKTVFTVTGGGAMFLNDACAGSKIIKTVCNHHEQACAMAAVGYSKMKNCYAATILTTGCGATNSITGLLDAWQDNNPVIFISGQVKRKETTRNAKVPLRQFGVQEADIIQIVKSITKYSVMINKPGDILFCLEKASFEAKNGRPGPVWIDIPLDVQGSLVDYSCLKRFNAPKRTLPSPTLSQINLLKKALAKSKRPIVIAGNGIRLGNSIKEFKDFLTETNIPFVTSYLGVDLLPNNHKQYIGRAGIKGNRAGNFALQNADLVISIGCHLSVSLTGFEYKFFSRDANLFVVDIDKKEHKKNTVKINHFIHSDVNQFFVKFKGKFTFIEWLRTCKKWKEKWPTCLPKYKNDKLINKYQFIESMQKELKSNSVVVSDAGSTFYVTSQAFQPIKNQRYITSGAQADMGFTLPAAIGAAFAQKDRMIVGITGDGSFQMNIQELQTLIHYKIPVKLVIWNNDGYLSIRTTQKKFFSGREIGTDKNSGVSFPSTKKIASAYNIPYISSKSIYTLRKNLSKAFSIKGPVIIEIFCPPMQEIIPTASSTKHPDGRMISKPLEDMYPFLSRDEFYDEMIVKPIKE